MVFPVYYEMNHCFMLSLERNIHILEPFFQEQFLDIFRQSKTIPQRKHFL